MYLGKKEAPGVESGASHLEGVTSLGNDAGPIGLGGIVRRALLGDYIMTLSNVIRITSG